MKLSALLFKIWVKGLSGDDMKIVQPVSIIAILLGIVAIIIGSVFLGIGVSKNNLIVDRMKIENVTIALDPNKPDVYTRVVDAESAQEAADIIASHRRQIAPTYQDLLGGKKFDASNTTQLTYVQAMNLENYLYLAVTAFGLIQVAMASGGFMIIAGLALSLLGFGLYRFAKAYNKEHLPS